MKRLSALRILFALGLAVFIVQFAGFAVAGEQLPDASELAYASPRRPKPPPTPTMSDVTLTGTITTTATNGMTLNASKSGSKQKTKWFVAAQTDADITIHGTATLEYLRKGQTVEFTAQLVNNEKLADKLKELTIVARKSGAARNEAAKIAAAKDRAAGAAATKTAPGGEASLSVPEDYKPTSKDAPAGSKADAVGEKTKIFGRVATIDGNRFTMSMGERTIHVELIEIPTINVEIDGPVVISDPKTTSKIKIEGPGASGKLVTLTGDDLIGAKIVVKGHAAELKTNRQCAAKSMDITLAKPLTVKTITPGKTSTSTTTSTTKEPADK
jgi:hypothetical protein